MEKTNNNNYKKRDNSFKKRSNSSDKRSNNFDKKDNSFKKRDNDFRKRDNDSDKRTNTFDRKDNDYKKRDNNYGKRNNSSDRKDNDFRKRDNDSDKRNNNFDKRSNSFDKRENKFDKRDNGYNKGNENSKRRSNNFDNRSNKFDKRENKFDKTEIIPNKRDKVFDRRENKFVKRDNAYNKKENSFDKKENNFNRSENSYDNRNDSYDKGNYGFDRRNSASDKWEKDDRKKILSEKIKVEEYIYGKHIVMSALENKNSVQELFVLEDNEKLIKIAKQKDIKYSIVDKSFFEKRFYDKVHQGHCAKLNPYDYWELKNMIASAKKSKENPIFVVLDKVTDPHNFGAIIRNVAAFDIDGIIIGKHNQSLINSTVHKISAGATFLTKICLINNINNSISTLKENGFWIVGTSLESKTQLSELDKKTSYAFILGSEGKGISALTSKHCDMNVIIPISDKIDSLNVSVASGILMYEIKK